MKKSITKSFGIILSIFFAFACVMISGCGNKYKKMEFNVQYAFSSDADEWYDADDDISLIMGENGDIKKDEFGVGTLYIKIDVSGVKAKHIDDIVVSKLANGGPNFSSVTVKEGEVFAIDIHETEKVVNSLKIYETKSKKSEVIDLEVYQEVTEIVADMDNNPAVMVGGSIDLKKCNNLKFLSNGLEGLASEDQKKVEYSIIDRIGFYKMNQATGKYEFNKYQNSSQISPKLELSEDGVLKVKEDYALSQNTYVVRINAKSVGSEVACEFDVYIVDKAGSDFNMAMHYDNIGPSGKPISVGESFTLYPGSDMYSNATVIVNCEDLSEYYLEGRAAGFGLAKFRPVVYIDGEKCSNNISSDFGLGYNVVYNDATKEYIYTFSAFPTGKYSGYNVEIKMEIEGLDFSCSDASFENYRTATKIFKKVLPKEIRINNDAGYVTDTVYLQDDSYNEIELKLNTFPVVDENIINYPISLTTSAGIVVKYVGPNGMIEEELASNEELENIPAGATLYITLNSEVDRADLTFQMQTYPETFNGVAVTDGAMYTKAFSLKGEMTAKSVEIYADAECEELRTVNKPLIIDANNPTSFFVKVNAKKIASFVEETVSFSLGNQNEIVLSADNFVENVDQSTAVYKVTLNEKQTAGQLNTIHVNFAGYGTKYSFQTKAVNTMENEDSITVKAGNSMIRAIKENEYFALEHGSEAQLVVEGKVAGSNIVGVSAISGVQVVKDSAYDLDKLQGQFDVDAVVLKSTDTNPIRIQSSIIGKTTVFKIDVVFYVYSESNIVTKTVPVDVQVATYNPIKTVAMSTEKEEIVYINEFFENAAKTSIHFEINNDVTTELNFGTTDPIDIDVDYSKNNSNKDADKTLSGLKIYSSVEPGIRGIGVDFYILKNGGKIYLDEDYVNKGKEIHSDLDKENILEGDFYVQLNEANENIDEILITLVATRLGEEESISTLIKIKVVQHNTSPTNITLVGSDIKSEGADSNYIYLKKGEVANFVAIANNDGNNKYTDLAYKFHEIEKDEFGNINYELGYAKTSPDTQNSISVKDFIDEVKYKGLPLDGEVELTANNAGLYLMEIYALDSYDKEDEEFKKTVKLFINISDGTEKNPYIIRNVDDFNAVEIDKHYVFGRNFSTSKQKESLIDLGANYSKVEVFNGSIKGTVEYLKADLTKNKTVRYTLKYTAKVDTDGNVALFKKANAKFENFDISTSYNIMSSQDLSIGGLVVENAGTIKNVGLFVDNSTIETSGKLNYGGLVVTNNGTIDLVDSNVVVKKLLVNGVAEDSNIGLIAANNSNIIKADYSGIESLDTLNFDVMANVSVESSNDVNVGGIVGNMTAGTISNILVGGRIVSNASGNVAGIVAEAKGEINTVATFALDVVGTGSANVAGIVAHSSKMIINNVRVESAEVEFTSLEIISKGKIAGSGSNVAGIVANSHTDDEVIYAAVESFIDTIGNSIYYMLENANYTKIDSSAIFNSNQTYYVLVDGMYNEKVVTSDKFESLKDLLYTKTYNGKVFGLASGGSVEKSFVDANIAGATIYLTSNGTNKNTYFIGNINKEFAVSSNYTNNTTYAVLYNSNEYKEVGTIPTPVADDEIWSIEKDYNKIGFVGFVEKVVTAGTFENLKDNLYTTTDNITYTKVDGAATFDNTITYYTNSIYYPYLLKDEKPFMIIRPTWLGANINESKVEEIGSIYISEKDSGITINKVDFEYTTDDIDEIVIINYYNDSNNPLNNERLNSYNIKDLITTKVEPEGATGAIMFKIVEGASYARIENNKTIVFLGVGGKNPIIIKCYSVTNPNLVKYIAFFTEYGYTDVTLSGTNVETVVGADGVTYAITINTAPTSAANRLEINAENLKEDFYTNIFDANNDLFGSSDFIDVVVDSSDDEDGLLLLSQVAPNNLTGFTLKYDTTKDFTGNETEIDIEFEVRLNLTKYFGENIFPKNGGASQYYTLKTLKLKVKIVKTATNLVISNKPSKITTDSALTFNAVMDTGYFGVADEGSVGYNIENNTVRFNEDYKDSMYFTISPESGYEDRVLNLLKQAGLVKTDETECKNIPSLFESFDIKYSVNKKDGKKVGYTYYIKTKFVDEYSYRYITEDIKLKFNVYSKFNVDINDSFVLTIKPSALDSAEIKNYVVTTTNTAGSDGVYQLFEVEQSDSYIISPGNRGGIMVVNLEPNYANLDWDKVNITSSPLYIPEHGRDVYLSFEQVAFNRQTGRYETVPYNDYHYDSEGNLIDINIENGDNKGIKLFPYSEVDGVKTRYTGKIYIYVSLTYFKGVKETISAYLTAATIENDSEKIVESRIDLITQYLPGVDIKYSGISLQDNDGYLIQENSSDNQLNIKLYGYQFNTNPVITFIWDGGTNKYAPINVTNTNFESLKNSLYVFDGTDYNKVATGAIYDEDAKYFIEEDITKYLSYRTDNSVIHNPDGSTSLRVYIRITEDLPCNFKINIKMDLHMDDGQTSTSSEASMRFYPVNYILDSAYVEDLHTIINTNNKVNMHFNTKNKNVDLTYEIYKMMLNDLTIGTDYSKFLDCFSYSYKGNIVKFSDVADDLDNNYPEFDVKFLTYTNNDGTVDRYLTIQALNTINVEVVFNIQYGFVDSDKDGTYEIKFGTGSRSYSATFNLRIDASTTEEHAIPIDTAEKFVKFMTESEGQDFILTNDIVLEDYVPIATKIASLDGNNRVIKIKSFNISSEATANYGLFSSFGTCSVADSIKQSILKNVVVDYSEIEDIKSPRTTTNVVFGGLVANNNGGLIYNCDVINLSNKEKSVNIYIDQSTRDHKIIAGGLVGINGKSDQFTGTVTNSRVGRDSFTKVSVDTYGNVSEKILNAGKINFVLGYSEFCEGYNPDASNMNGFVGVTGAFVGENKGTISSSYVSRTSLLNYSTSALSSKTSGFVAENSGRISYSYVQADPNTLSSTNPYASGSKIEAVTDGKVAGFVFTNRGEVNNSYANTVLVSHANFMSGFAYENSGLLKESYSSCTLNAIGGSDASEQPFIGSENGLTTLSTGEIENCYYYKDSNNFKTSATPKKIGNNQATGMSLTNFRDSEMLYGFVFVLANSRAESEQGVWSYYTQEGEYRVLPELTSTNIIATSYRYLVESSDDEYNYINAIGYKQGTKVNPYIIRNVEEYNQIMTANGMKDSMVGYVRFIADIDFTGKDVVTHANFVLGDKSNRNITSIDGNGMSLKGIYLDAPSKDIESIGIFAEIENAYIKNLDIKFDKALYSDNFSSIRVKYSGGLAGKINNSVIINITLDGTDTTLAGSNAVGGLAGLISGNSLIYGIESNLSVNATQHENNYYLYYSEEEFKSANTGFLGNYSEYVSRLSYAGGLAGIIDIYPRANEKYNISYINIFGDQMGSNSKANISGDYVGGISGYAGLGTSSYKLKYYTGTSDRMVAGYSAGGLYGFSMGKILASQVTAEEGTTKTQSGTQYAYDTEFGSYIIGLENDTTTTLNKTGVGNISLISSTYYAGGLVGIGVNTDISSSYSKASFKSSQVIGGLIGVSVSSKILYSYAVTYVNIDMDNLSKDRNDGEDTDGIALQKVGGLIGVAYGNTSEDRQVIDGRDAPEVWFKSLERIADSDRAVPKINNSNDVQFAFSSLLVDHTLLESAESENKFTDKEVISDGYNIKIDYVCPDYEHGNQTRIKSDSSSELLQVYTALINYGNGYLSNITCLGEEANNGVEVQSINKVDLYTLYDVDYPEHVLYFNRIFSTWPTKYWTLNPDRYFPLLIDQEPVDYIEIWKPSDISKIVNNPSGNFIVKADINMADYRGTVNSIVKKPFTGTIKGDTDTLKRVPAIYNIKIEETTEGANVGFFASSDGAIFSDLIFSYQNDAVGINITKNNNIVGGLTAVDKNSTISNVSVWAGDYQDGESKINTATNLVDNDSENISIFGGIVGDSTNTTIIGVDFNADLTMKMSGGDQAYFGGLVGRAVYNENADDFDSYEGFKQTPNMMIASSTIQANLFSINIKSVANIGGVVGSIESGVVNDVETNANFVLNSDNFTINFGGLIGTASNEENKLSIKSNNVKLSTVMANLTCTGTNTANIAGLIGLYLNNNIETEIYSSHSAMNIVFETGTNINTLYVSQGIAQAKGNYVAMRSCLLTGKIEQNGGSIINVDVAGVVAYSIADELVLQEVMSTTDITLGDNTTKKFVAGGLVSEAEQAIIKYSVSSGKIVPTTANYNPDNTIVLIGGIAGWIKSGTNADIYNSYTTSSIITDRLANDVLQGYGEEDTTEMKGTVRINALFGKSCYGVDNGGAKADISNVFYSTDFALAPEDSKLGTNLSANSMIYDKTNRYVYNGVISGEAEDFWTLTESNDGSDLSQLPFISSLTTALVDNGIIEEDSGKYIYAKTDDSENGPLYGTSLQPEIINSTGYTFKDEFTYYILDSRISDLYFTNTKPLNGVLIGAETQYTIDIDNMDNQSGVYGVIPQVEEGSAVSNLHIDLGSDISDVTYNLTGKDKIGFVVGSNNGVIFNCSTQGTGITFEGSSEIGIITYTNEGMVSYSYSSVEIIKAQNCRISGVVFSQAGKMISDYFTGYVAKFAETDANEAAGLIYKFGTSSYTYNCYMGGVIKCLVGSNSFNYIAFDTNNTGSNNYIDQWANIEHDLTVEVDGKRVLISVDSVELMSSKDLAGNWSSIIAGEIKTVDGVDTFTVNTANNSGFGRNYGYPIYDMNKFGPDQQLDSLPYYLDTGKGSNSINDWFKIPHLGVFSIVDGILNADVTDGYYLLIYNINANDKDLNGKDWSKHAVGKTVKEGGEQVNFTGVLRSHLNYKTPDSFTLNEACMVENLKVSGLFNRIGEADIEFIKFGSMTELENSGAIGQTVTGSTKINSIEFKDNSTLSGTRVGALFGTIDADQQDIEINNWNYNNVSASDPIPNNMPIITASEVAGLISAEIKKGNLKLSETTVGSSKDYLNYYVGFVGCELAGGLVGELNGGTIESGATNKYIYVTIQSTNNMSLGGLVGSATDGEVSDAMLIRTQSTLGGPYAYEANSFGGLICKVAGDIKFTNCYICLERGSGLFDYTELTINARNISDAENNQGFGFLAGVIEKGTFTVNNFKIIEDKNDLSKITCSTLVVKSTSNVYNIGGIAGRYEAANQASILLDQQSYGYITGKITLASGEEVSCLNLYGYNISNIGGAFGLVSGVLDASKFGEDYNFLQKGDKFATIKAISGNNMGGLIGKVADGVITGLINANDIVIPMFSGSGASKFTNIGGVFGCVESATLADLKNKGSIVYETYQDTSPVHDLTFIKGNKDPITGVISKEMLTIYDKAYGLDGKQYSSVRTLNVGGIAGSATNVIVANNILASDEITQIADAGLISDSDIPDDPVVIEGYQNVGGIFGYADKVTDIHFTKSSENYKTITIGANIYLLPIQQLTTLSTGATSFDTTTNMYFIENAGGYTSVIPELNASGQTGQNYYYTDKASLDSLDDTMTSKSIVVGALNVGGAFGCIISNESEIYGANVVNARVYGNVNVGGFAGHAPEGEFNFNKVGDPSNDVIVKGLYYAITEKHQFVDRDHVKNKSQYFIPTSIGGFIGKSIPGDPTSTEVMSNQGSKLFGNKLSNVKISTTEEGWPSLQLGYDQMIDDTSVISTIKNKVLRSGNTSDLDTGTASPDFWNAMRSGIGGFVGTINSNSMGIDISSNNLSSVIVEASLGINVGGYYGYFLQVGDTSEFKTPEISGSINVSGAYIVGGVIGFYDLIGKAEEGSTDATLENLNYTGSGNIQIQNSSITGMYIGGFIGRLNGSAKNIKLESGDNIKIYTDGNFYVGGLFGRLEGSLKSDSSGGSWTGTSVESGIVEGNAVDNFGGLVGMLKVKTDSLVVVEGAHEYWFTVNTVENSNYLDGDTITGAYDSSGVYITAVAYYVNADTINIAGSGITPGTELDGSVETGLSEWNYTKGPFGKSYGWAKEYTMFRYLQRNIPRDENNGAEWDSIAVVYDASAIREVFTRDVKKDDNNNGTRDDLLGNGTPNKTGAVIEDYIDYTIYEDREGSPTLYTSFGIATAAIDSTGKDTILKKNCYKNGVELTETETADGKLEISYKTQSDRKAIVSNFTWHDGFYGKEMGYNDSGWENYNGYFNANIKFDLNLSGKNWYELKCLRYYAVKVKYDLDKNNNGTWFVFDKLMGHASQYENCKKGNEYEYNVEDEGAEQTMYFDSGTEKHASYDGCLFNISVSMPRYHLDSTPDNRNWFQRNWWKILIAVVLIVGACIAAYFTGGASFASLGVVAKFFVVVGIKLGIGLLYAGGIIFGAWAIFDTGAAYSKNTFFDKDWQSYGFISQTYTRELKFSGGKLTYNTADSGEVSTDMPYYYYSDVRPADYYQNRYFSFVSTATAEVLSDVITTYSTTQVDLDVGGNIEKVWTYDEYGNLIPKTPEELGGVYDYYIYVDGSYYIIAYAGNFSYSVQQTDASEDDKLKNKANIRYITDNGVKYVVGKSDIEGSSYKLGDGNPQTNNYTSLTYNSNNGQYKINGVVWNQTQIDRLYGTGIETTKEKEMTYAYYGSAPAGLEEIDGYTKLTRNVSYAEGEADFQGKMKSIMMTKVGVTYTEGYGDGFKYYGFTDYEVDNDGIYDSSNFLFDSGTGTYVPDSNTDHSSCTQHYKPVTKYYKYQYGSLKEDVPSGDGNNGDSTIYIAVHPTGFTNDGASQWVNENETWHLHKGYYSTGFAGTIDGLTHTQTYYFYDNPNNVTALGVGSVNETTQVMCVPVKDDKLKDSSITLYQDDGTVFKTCNLEDYKNNYSSYREYYTLNPLSLKVSQQYMKDVDNKIYYFNYADRNGDGLYDAGDEITNKVEASQPINIYESNGTKIAGSPVQLTASNWDSYKDKYYGSKLQIKAYYSCFLGSDGASAGVQSGNLVANTLYVKTSNPVAYGLPASVKQNIPNANKYWYYNKYLMGKDTDFYTRYKYSNEDWFNKHVVIAQNYTYDSSGNETAHDRYIVPETNTQTYPNGGTTYLAESVNITIGGRNGLEIYLKNSDKNAAPTTSGYIQLAIPG